MKSRINLLFMMLFYARSTPEHPSCRFSTAVREFFREAFQTYECSGAGTKHLAKWWNYFEQLGVFPTLVVHSFRFVRIRGLMGTQKCGKRGKPRISRIKSLWKASWIDNHPTNRQRFTLLKGYVCIWWNFLFDLRFSMVFHIRSSLCSCFGHQFENGTNFEARFSGK